MSDQTSSTGPRPAKKNPAPPTRRVFLHYDVTIGAEQYEIHPGPRLGGGLTVYQRTKAGLRRVNDRMKALAVIREYDAQNNRARELAAQIARTEAARKPSGPSWLPGGRPVAERTTRQLLIGVTATRLALVYADMRDLQSKLAATMPGKMASLEERLDSWAEVARDGARLLRELDKEDTDA